MRPSLFNMNSSFHLIVDFYISLFVQWPCKAIQFSGNRTYIAVEFEKQKFLSNIADGSDKNKLSLKNMKT